MVPRLKTPILNCFYLLLLIYILSDCEFSSLAMLAKPHPVSGPPPLPQIPNQLHCIQRSAYEVMDTILGT